MSDASQQGWLTRRSDSRVAWCLLLSFGLHLLGLVAFVGLRQLALFRPDALPKWLSQAVLPKADSDLAKKDPVLVPEEPKPEIDPSLVFVEVDPQAVTEEAPSKTPFYSTANTLAANTKPAEKPSEQPKIEGSQEKMVRTFDNDRPRPFAPAQPPQPAQTQPPTDVVLPKVVEPAVSQQLGGVPIGETAFAKPVPMAKVPKPQPAIRPEAPPTTAQARTDTPPPLKPEPKPEMKLEPTPAQPAKPARPRSLAEARANRGILVGETMKQEGGVSRLNIVPSLDVRSSPFGNYDAAMIYIVQQAWFALLDEARFTYERSGKVVLRFKLRADGSITDLKTLESEVGDTLAFLCETAIIKPQPFARWPADMRREVGSDTREITWTFHYQ